MRNRSFNQYDICIVLLLASLAMGNIGGALQISRILALFLFPVFLKKIKLCMGEIRNYLLFVMFFLVSALVSLLWSPDKIRGIEEIVYFIVHFLFFFELLAFAQLSMNPINSTVLGWVIAMTITLICASWELITDNHLSISLQEANLAYNTGEVIIQRRFASVTFGNYNTYVTFLCFGLPFSFLYLFDPSKTILHRLFVFIIYFLSLIVVLFNASRGGLLCLGIILFTYVFFSSNNKYKYIIILLMFVLLFFVINYVGDQLFATIIARSSDGGFLKDSSRFQIWQTAAMTFWDSLCFGTGVGGVELWMNKFTNGINVPHNLFIEVFLEFGIVIGSIFILFVFYQFFKSRRITNRSRRLILYIVFLSMPFATIINSRYLLFPFQFAYFASIIVFMRYDLKKIPIANN